MNEIDKECIEIYKKIKLLKSVSKDEILMMELFTKKYIDPKCKICSTCPAQIRFAWNRILNWGEKHQIELRFDDVEVKPNICECGNPTKDKRYKKCEGCKK